MEYKKLSKWLVYSSLCLAKFVETTIMMRTRYNAFSLTEMLVVLVIIGILILVALPNFLPKIVEAKTQEAKLQLSHLCTLQKSYFFMNSRYSESLSDVGFEQIPLVSEGGSANYRIKVVEASPSGFLALATSVVDFDGDGVFNEWSIDENKKLVETTKD